MSQALGKVVAGYGNMLTASFDTNVRQNEVAYVVTGESRLKCEVIRVKDNLCYMQAFEDTRGVKVGDQVQFTKDLLIAELGPGLLGQIYDGLQNPLPKLAAKCGLFLTRGVYLESLDRDKKWEFTPIAKVGDVIAAGMFWGPCLKGSSRTRSLCLSILSARPRSRTLPAKAPIL